MLDGKPLLDLKIIAQYIKENTYNLTFKVNN
jgi:hypothetical protein